MVRVLKSKSRSFSGIRSILCGEVATHVDGLRSIEFTDIHPHLGSTLPQIRLNMACGQNRPIVQVSTSTSRSGRLQALIMRDLGNLVGLQDHVDCSASVNSLLVDDRSSVCNRESIDVTSNDTTSSFRWAIQMWQELVRIATMANAPHPSHAVRLYR